MILAHTDVAIGPRSEVRNNAAGLIVPDLHGEHSVWREACRSGFDDSSDEAKTIRSPVKRGERVVLDLPLKDSKFGRRDIWQIGDDPVEALFARRKKIRFVKGDPSIQ